MEGVTTFTSDKQLLEDMLKDVSAGNIQLPEFQRGWIWDDARICSLLASVSLSYPIGAVMMLENGNPDVRFKPRPIQGVELPDDKEPNLYVLDGQQRLTSLYQTLSYGRVVETQDSRKHAIKRWYYIDIRKALDPNVDREDAIVSLPEDKVVRNFRNEVLENYSTPEAEYEKMLFPVGCLFDDYSWRWGYLKFWEYSEDKNRLFTEFEKAVVDRFRKYQLPVITMYQNTPKVAVCQVFEKVNTGGVALTVFELVTASFAADGFNLREDWEGKHDAKGRKVGRGRKDRIHDHPQHKNLHSVGADELLQSVTLLTTQRRRNEGSDAPVSCKRNDILRLTLADYKSSVEQATQGFIAAGKFLFQQKLFTSRDLPYSTQVVPLSVILTLLGTHVDNDAVRQKLIRWFWCGVFGELYAGSIETRFARDVTDVLDWVLHGGEEPKTIADCNFVPARLNSLRTRNSAAYKGLYALLMRDGGLDFLSGEPIEVQTYFESGVDIHHIFPRAWCEKHGIKPTIYDSIINKTPLSYRTNRIIGGNAPSVYLERLRGGDSITSERQDQILRSHLIDVDALRNDDFETFFNNRKEALLRRIEAATGKTIAPEAPMTGTDAESLEDELLEDESE